MLNLVLATDSIAMISSAAKTIDVQVSGVDDLADVFTPWKQNTAFTNAATADIADPPAGGAIRNVKFISIRNKDAASSDVTVQYDANGTLYELFKCTLATMEELVCREGIWFHFDANGAVYGTSVMPVASDTLAGDIRIATAAEQVTGTSTVIATTPGRQHLHPAATKKYVSCGVAADIQQSYGVSSLTDGGTGLVTINFTSSVPQFAAATYCVVGLCEMGTTTYSVANQRNCFIQSGTRNASSVGLLCLDSTNTTELVKDPTTWHAAMWGALA